MIQKAKKEPKAKKSAASSSAKAANPAAHKLPAREISDAIIDLIERQIFVPGERLLEQDLADRFSVTRGRIREALHVLETRGFVHIERMKGATIARYDDTEFVAIGEVRSALLALAARRAANLATDEERDQILNLGRELATRGGDMTPKEFRSFTVMIANHISDAARSPYLRRLIDDVHHSRDILRIYRTLVLVTRARRVQSSKNWLLVTEAIKKGDATRAGKLIERIHLQGRHAVEVTMTMSDE